MPFYVKVGKVPPKRHITFYKDDGKSLYREELFSTLGFSGIYSNKYHIYMPTQVKKIGEIPQNNSNDWKDAPLQYYHFFTEKKKTGGDILSSRNEFLKNENCVISTANVSEDSEFFFRNSYAHELIFVHRGRGEFISDYGRLPFEEWDYIVVPKGSTYQIKFDRYDDNKLMIIESSTPFDIPRLRADN